MAISRMALPSFQHGLNGSQRVVGTKTVSTDIGNVLAHLDATYHNLDLYYESDIETLWCYQVHTDRPCFSEGLLRDVQTLQLSLKDLLDDLPTDRLSLKYLIWASSLPGVYNLGGDLDLFCRLIRAGDADGLLHYAKSCIDICFLNKTNMGLPIQTVALVQGDALGGGFESVLSNDLIIAEEGVKFGFPEVVFNLFPGMGAFSFISRRLDASRARAMIMNGRLYRAEELYDMGIIDLIVPAGSGEREMRSFIDGHTRRFGMLEALSQVERRCQPLCYEELMDIAAIWVNTAMKLGDQDLHRMERLTAAQERRRQQTLSH